MFFLNYALIVLQSLHIDSKPISSILGFNLYSSRRKCLYYTKCSLPNRFQVAQKQSQSLIIQHYHVSRPKITLENVLIMYHLHSLFVLPRAFKLITKFIKFMQLCNPTRSIGFNNLIVTMPTNLYASTP